MCVCVCARITQQAVITTQKPLWIRPLAPTPVTEKMMKMPSQHLLFFGFSFCFPPTLGEMNNGGNKSGLTHRILDSHLTRSRNVHSSRTSQTFHWNIRNIPMEYWERLTGNTLSSPQRFTPKHYRDFKYCKSAGESPCSMSVNPNQTLRMR